MLSNAELGRILVLEQEVTRLTERVDNLRRDGLRVEASASVAATLAQDVDKRLALAVRDLDKLEKRPDELLARRWELWKLVVAALLGGILTLAGSVALKSIDRFAGMGTVPAAPNPARR